MRRRVFQRGEPLQTMAELCAALDGGRWLYWVVTPRHPEIFKSMTWRTLQIAVKHKRIFYAVVNDCPAAP